MGKRARKRTAAAPQAAGEASSASSSPSSVPFAVHRMRCADWMPGAVVALRFNRTNEQSVRLAVVRDSGEIEVMRCCTVAGAVFDSDVDETILAKNLNDAEISGAPALYGTTSSGFAKVSDDAPAQHIAKALKKKKSETLDADEQAIEAASVPAKRHRVRSADSGMQHRHRRLRWVCEWRLSAAQELHTKSVVWAGGDGQDVPMRLYTAGLSGTIVRWNLSSLRPHAEVDSNGGGPIWALEPSPCGRWLAAGCEDGSARLFRIVRADEVDSTGRPSLEPRDFEVPTTSLSVASQNSLLDDADDNDAFGRPTAGLVFARALPRSSARVTSIAWHPDASKFPGRIYAGGADGKINVLSALGNGSLVRTLNVGSRLGEGQQTVIWSLAALRDGTLISGDSQGATRFWDTESGVLSQSFEEHQSDVLCVRAFETRGSRTLVYSAGVDSKVCLFRSVQVVDELQRTHGNDPLNKWIFVSSQRAHSHDVQAMDILPDLEQPTGVRRKRNRRRADGEGSAHEIPALLATGSIDTRIGIHSATDMRAPAARLLSYPQQRTITQSDIAVVPRQPTLRDNSNPATADRLFLVQHSNALHLWRLAVPSKSAMIAVCDAAATAVSSDGGRDPRTSAPETKTLGQAGEHRLVCEIQPSFRIHCAAVSSDGLFVAAAGATETVLYQLVHDPTGRNGPTVRRIRPKGNVSLPSAHRLTFLTTADCNYCLLASAETPTRLISVSLPIQSGKRASLSAASIVELPLPSSTEEENFGPVVSLHASSDPRLGGAWLACGDSNNIIHVFWSNPERVPSWKYFATFPVVGSQHTALCVTTIPGLADLALGGQSADKAMGDAALVVSCMSNGVLVYALDSKRLLRYRAAIQDRESPLRKVVHPIVDIYRLSDAPASMTSDVVCFGLNYICRITLSVVPNDGTKVTKCLEISVAMTNRFKPLLLARPLPVLARKDFMRSLVSEEDEEKPELAALELLVCEQPWDRISAQLPETLWRAKYAT